MKTNQGRDYNSCDRFVRQFSKLLERIWTKVGLDEDSNLNED